MAKLKMLKLPKQPKLPKKPKQSASVATKKRWLERVQDVKAKYVTRLNATKSENARREKENKESDRLNTVISGISGVKVFSRGFSARVTHKRKSHHHPVKRAKKAAHKKAAHKKKSSGKSFKTHKWIKGRGWVKKR